MKYAIVNDNAVIEVRDFESEESAQSIAHTYQHVILIDGMSPEPEVGWSFGRDGLYRQLNALTPRQIRTALVAYGVDLSMIDAALNSLPEPTRSFAKISWEYSIQYFRDDPLVDSVAVMLGWTPQHLDELWILGASL